MIAIACCGLNNEIGKDNKLIFDFAADKKLFKRITMGTGNGKTALIMGSKTFNSLRHPLENRYNIVLTSNPDKYKYYMGIPEYRDTRFVSSMEEALKTCISLGVDYKNLILIGGERVYRDNIHLCEMVIITRVEKTFPGADAFFPSLDDFILYDTSNKMQDHLRDTNEEINFTIELHVNKSSPKEIEADSTKE